jgi:hypothetical protein
MTKPLGITKKLKIHMNVIPYIATFIVSKNNVVYSSYSILLRRPWLRNAKVTRDWGHNVITIEGNGKIETILINGKLVAKTRRPQVFVCYHLMEGLVDEEEDLIFETKPKLLSISTIILSEEIISLLSVGVLKIKSIEEFDLKQRT